MTRLLALVPAVLAFLSLIATAVHGQNTSTITGFLGSGVSVACTAALVNITSDAQLNKCIPLTSIATVIPSAANTTTTAAQLDAVLDQICGAPACDDSVISATLNSLGTNCGPEINGNQSLVSLVYYGFAFYPAIYKGVCLKNAQGKYCVDESLANYQAYENSTAYTTPTNTTSTNSTANAISELISAPNSIICTACNKNLVNVFVNFASTNPVIQKIPNVTQDVDIIKGTLTSKCGADFIDATTTGPSATGTSSTNGTSAKPSAAARSTVPALGGLLISVVAVVAVAATWVL